MSSLPLRQDVLDSQYWSCVACNARVRGEDPPADWYGIVIACGLLLFCGACQRQWGGASVLRLKADEIHRSRGGCAACRVRP